MPAVAVGPTAPACRSGSGAAGAVGPPPSRRTTTKGGDRERTSGGGALDSDSFIVRQETGFDSSARGTIWRKPAHWYSDAMVASDSAEDIKRFRIHSRMR